MESAKMNQLKEDAFQFGVELNEKQLSQFQKYYEMLIEWNEKINLTAITEFEEVLKKHFLDSISIGRLISQNEEISILDIGTGAGFPGIPIKIAFPCVKVTLLDSLNKRVNFLNEVIKELSLEGISALHGRAEDFAKKKEMREQFDFCVSRAVANLTTLSEYCIPYVKEGGSFISYKSGKVKEEIKEVVKLEESKGETAGEFIEIGNNKDLTQSVEVLPQTGSDNSFILFCTVIFLIIGVCSLKKYKTL